MPRNARCVLPGIPYHVTQRGTDRQRVFFLNSDREMYLRLLSRNLTGARVRVLAYALMTNHIHAGSQCGRLPAYVEILRPRAQISRSFVWIFAHER